MGVEIKLTDKQFPVSPVFIDFLHRYLQESPFETSWHDQLSEELVAPQGEIQKIAESVAGKILEDPVGQKVIYRSYEILTAILTGALEKLKSFQERYRFICIVGCPRHGGSYLTKQLFIALGMDPNQVPNVIAHDGFPDASPFDLKEGYNAHTNMTQKMAEYLAMVELFFSNSRLFNNFIIVPKKATKAAYYGAFFDRVLGPNTEYIITLRHPVAACISTYEKSTGLPAEGKFKVRGNIEEWARRDNVFTGEDPQLIFERDYFDVYLRYWEQYHINLVLSGLTANKNLTIVTYGKDRMTKAAQSLYTRFKCKGTPEEFKVFGYQDRHTDWHKKAAPVIKRVADVWRSVGIVFPTDEVIEGW
jgi:hypothetical protein